MAELHKYGTSGKFYVPLLLASTQNFASTSAITFASSDVTIVKDGSTYRNLTNTPTGIAMGSAAVFQVVTSASEMTAEKIAIQIKDETGALVQDQMLIIDTYGSSAAAHEFDLDQSIENSTMNAVVSVTSDVSGKVVGAVGSVTGNVGGSVASVTGNVDGNVTGSVTSVSSDVAGKVVGSVASVTGNVGGNVTGSVGSISSTAALPSNLVQVKASTANTDNWVTNIDGTVSSRMSSTKSVLGSTQGAQLSTTAVNAVSTGVKSEINDLIFTDASSDASSLTGNISIGNKVAWSFQRFFRHHQQDSSTQAIMDSGSTSSVAAKMTVTNTTGLQTVQEAST
jgi:hypothetical protein